MLQPDSLPNTYLKQLAKEHLPQDWCCAEYPTSIGIHFSYHRPPRGHKCLQEGVLVPPAMKNVLHFQTLTRKSRGIKSKEGRGKGEKQ